MTPAPPRPGAVQGVSLDDILFHDQRLPLVPANSTSQSSPPERLFPVMMFRTSRAPDKHNTPPPCRYVPKDVPVPPRTVNPHKTEFVSSPDMKYMYGGAVRQNRPLPSMTVREIWDVSLVVRYVLATTICFPLKKYVLVVRAIRNEDRVSPLTAALIAAWMVEYFARGPGGQSRFRGEVAYPIRVVPLASNPVYHNRNVSRTMMTPPSTRPPIPRAAWPWPKERISGVLRPGDPVTGGRQTYSLDFRSLVHSCVKHVVAACRHCRRLPLADVSVHRPTGQDSLHQDWIEWVLRPCGFICGNSVADLVVGGSPVSQLRTIPAAYHMRNPPGSEDRRMEVHITAASSEEPSGLTLRTGLARFVQVVSFIPVA